MFFYLKKTESITAELEVRNAFLEVDRKNNS